MAAKRSALIVATSQYKDPRLAPLEGPGRDAEGLRTVLANKEIGGFDVRLAINSRGDSLRRTLEAFFADRGRDDLLLVHFSGHGLKDDDGQLYLAAADTQIDRLLSTGIDAAWVNRLMNRCRSERIALFLDCCFAGAFTTGMARRAGVESAGVKDQFNGSGLFVIAASDAMQYSFEGGHQVGQPPEPSPFTKALVDGLRTGEADRNEDGEVSINELFDYLEDRVRESSPSQTPTKSAFNQVGDWVIARSTRQPSVRLLPEELQGNLKSDEPLDRFGALIDLRDLIEGPDSRLAEAALQALKRLTEDDSRRVAAAAKRLLDEETARPRSATRGSRRRVSSPALAPTAEMARDVAWVSIAPVVASPTLAPQNDPIAAPPTPVASDLAPPVAVAAAGAAGLVGEDASAEMPWSLGQASSHIAIGSLAGVMIQFVWLLAANQDIRESEGSLSVAIGGFIQVAFSLVFVATVVVTIVERQVPAVRLPRGRAYRVLRGNRWLASAIVGAIVGLAFGLIVERIVLGAYFGTFSGSGTEIVLCTSLGFVVAEALVGRRFGGRPEEHILA
jgi:hypothetical protein